MHLLGNVIALAIDPATVTMVFNILLVALLVIILIGGLVALFRGVWNTTFRLLFVGTLVVLSYVFAKDITNQVASFDFSSMFSSPIQFELFEETITVTSGLDTMEQMIAAFTAHQENQSVQAVLSDPQTVQLIHDVAFLLLRFVIFVVLGVLIILLGEFLAGLFYHLLFKFFIPKKIRKHVRLRLVAFFEGIVKTTLVASMLVIPFSSLLNTISKSAKNGNRDIDNKTYQDILSFVDAYDNSYFSQLLFHWTADSNGNTFDMNLMNYTLSDSSEEGLIFTDELGTILDVAVTLFGSGSMEYDASTGQLIIYQSSILNSEVVCAVLDTLSRSSLLTRALPIAMAFALNMEEIQKYCDSGKIDLSAVEWSGEIQELSKIYKDVYDSGIITEVLDHPENALYEMLSNQSMHDSLMTAFEKIDSTTLVSQVLPAVLFTMVNQTDAEGNPSPLSSYLPTEWEDYAGISWGKEFSILYHSLFRLNVVTESRLLDIYMPKKDEVVDEVAQRNRENIFLKEAVSEETGEENKEENPFMDVINLLMDHPGAVKECLFGVFDESGKPVMDETTGLSTGEESCLFDSELITRSMNKIIKAVFTALQETLGEMDMELLNSAADSLDGRGALKKEYGAMFQILEVIAENEKAKGILTGQQIDLTDTEVTTTLKEAFLNLDQSVLMSNLIPEVIPNTLGKVEGLAESLQSVGLQLDSFVFRVDHLGSEIGKLLDVVPSMVNLSDAFSQMGENSLDVMLDAINAQDLETVLTGFYDSRILNPEVSEGKSNFETIIDVVFASKGIGVENITSNFEKGTIQWMDEEKDGVVTKRGEIGRICDLFTRLKEDDVKSLLNATTIAYENPDELQPDLIRDLFKGIGGSKLLSYSFGKVMDDMLSSVISGIDNTGAIAFSHLKTEDDWIQEGDNFATILENIQAIGKKVEQIDWLNANPEKIEGILLSLSQSNLFESEADFTNFVRNTFTTNKDIQAYFQDFRAETLDKTNAYFDSMNEGNIQENWKAEIGYIVDVLDQFQILGGRSSETYVEGNYGTEGLTKFVNGRFELEEVNLLVDSLNHSITMQMVLPNAIDEIFAQIDLSKIDVNLKAANIAYLVEMDSLSGRIEERKTEVLEVLSVYSRARKLNLQSGLTFTDLLQLEGKMQEIEEMLLSAERSQVFHKAPSTIEGEENVFLQMMHSIYHISGMDDIIYDNDLFLESYASAQVKRETVLQNFETLSKTSSSDVWATEISHVFDLLGIAKNLNITAMENIQVTQLKTDQIGDLLYTLNSCDTLYWAVPKYIKIAFGEMKISELSNHLENYLLAEKEVNREAYGKSAAEDKEITRIVELMKGTIQSDGTYLDFSSNQIANGSIELAPIIQYFGTSQIFQECRGLVILNALEKVIPTGYLRTVDASGNLYDKANGKTIFSDIFQEINGDKVRLQEEGNRLTNALMQLQNIDLNGNLLNFNLDVVQAIYQEGYSAEKKYAFVSEILSGVISRKIIEEGFAETRTSVEGYHPLEWYVENGNHLAYPLMNDVEKNGLYGFLKAASGVVGLAGATFSRETLTAAKNEISLGYASLESAEGQKSEIAMNTYHNGVYLPLSTALQNASIMVSADQKENYNTILASLKDNPYASSFHFADEKAKVEQLIDMVINSLPSGV